MIILNWARRKAHQRRRAEQLLNQRRRHALMKLGVTRYELQAIPNHELPAAFARAINQCMTLVDDAEIADVFDAPDGSRRAVVLAMPVSRELRVVGPLSDGAA